MLLQETHGDERDDKVWKAELGGGEYLAAHGPPSARGVLIYINKKLDAEIIGNVEEVGQEGRLLITSIKVYGKTLGLVNVYAPNLSTDLRDQTQHLDFLEKLHNKLKVISEKVESILVMGDINCILSKKLDASGGNPTIYSKSVEKIQEIMSEIGLIDIYRERYPEEQLFTYAPGGPNVRNIYRRLDYALISEELSGQVLDAEIKPAIQTDHRIILLNVELTKEVTRGKGYWKHNDLINGDSEYLND